MKIMALITAYPWIFSIILLNHGIITVSSFPISLDGLIDFGLNLLIDSIFNPGTGEDEGGMTMENLALKIDNLEETIVSSERTIINELSHLIKTNSALRDYSKAITYIDEIYELFHNYSVGFEKRTLKDFADLTLTIGDNGLTYKLHDLVETVSPSLKYTTPLLKLVVEPYEKTETALGRCDETISVQQEILNMYGEVATYIIKGYTIMFNAYQILRKSDQGQFVKEKELTKLHFEKAMRRVTEAAVLAMRTAPRDIRSCDAEEDKEGDTYIELKWLFNGFMITEEFLSDRYVCKKGCKAYYYGNVWLHYHNYEHLDELVQCGGSLHQCSTTRNQYYCPGTSGRRYDDAAITAEEIKNCQSPIHVSANLPVVDYLKEFGNDICHTCSCLCDEYNRPDTVRLFSLTPVISSTSKNKVITGLRFVQQDRRIHIQIQQGVLKRSGYIRNSTVKWQPIQYNRAYGDWHIRWATRGVNLDTLNFPAGQVMTGIKFDKLDGRLRLSIRAHRFDYSSGRLQKGHGNWTARDTRTRTAIIPKKPDIPINADEENIVASEEDLYINFEMTDWHKDLSQTATPFLDAQAVISNPPRPLSGAGLYFRGQEGYGGFLAFKLVAYNYAVVLAKNLVEDIDEDTDEVTDEGTDEETDGGTDEEIDEETDQDFEKAANVHNRSESAGIIEAALEYDFEFELPEGVKLGDLKKKFKSGQKRSQKYGQKHSQDHAQKHGQKRGSKNHRKRTQRHHKKGRQHLKMKKSIG